MCVVEIIHLTQNDFMAQTERFELPSHEDTGFQIRRNTRLCDVCSGLACGLPRMNLAAYRP